jgi:hypothetical protein
MNRQDTKDTNTDSDFFGQDQRDLPDRIERGGGHPIQIQSILFILSKKSAFALFVSAVWLGWISTPLCAASGERQVAFFPDDTRLARRVTVSEPGTTVAAALASVSKATGVKLAAEGDAGERGVTLFVRERPAREVMVQLRALFEDAWRRAGTPGAFRYTLYRSAASRERARHLQRQARAAEAARLRALFRAAEGPSPVEALQQVSPVVAAKWGRKHVRSLLALYRLGSLGRYSELLAGERATLLYRDLNEPGRVVVRQALADAAQWLRGESDEADWVDRAADAPDETEFQFWMDRGDAGQRLLTLEMRDRRQDTRLTIGIDVGVLRDSEPAGQALGGDSPRRHGDTEDSTEKSSERETAPSPADPRLALRLHLDREQAPRMHELLQWLAKQREVPAIYADYFLDRPREVDLGARWEGTLGELLAAVDRQTESAWNLDAAGLRLRSRTWAVDEAREPPPALMRALRGALSKQGRYELGDYVRATSLTVDQLDGLREWAVARGRRGEGDDERDLVFSVRRWRPLLLLVGTLTDAQRRALNSGVDARGMTDEQRQLFLRFAASLRPGVSAAELQDGRLQLREEPGRLAFVASFAGDRQEVSLPLRPPTVREPVR